MNKTVGVFIISRLNSSRLPNKAKLKLGNDTMIEFLVKRLKLFFKKNQIVICTALSKNNNFYQNISNKYKIKIFFGQNKNVLKRIIDCMNKYKFNHFARITGDNPLIDPISLKILIKNHLKNKNDYTFTNSIPWGLRSEVFSLKALIKCEKNIIDKNSTEYLTYFFKRKDYFKIQEVNIKKYHKKENNFSVSVDYLKDFKLLNRLLKRNDYRYNLKRYDIVDFLKNNSKLVKTLNKIPLKTSKYNVMFKDDKKKKYLNLSKQKTCEKN